MEFGFVRGNEVHIFQTILRVGPAESDKGSGHVMLQEAGDGVMSVLWGAVDNVSNVVVARVIFQDFAHPWE